MNNEIQENDGIKLIENNITNDLNAIISDFRRYSKYFLSLFLFTFAAIFIPLLLQPAKYTATSSVMLDPRLIKTQPTEDVLSGLPADTVTVDTEVEILKSYALADRVIEDAKLELDPEFNSHLRPRFFGLLPAESQSGLSQLEKQSRHQDVVEKVRKSLNIKRQGLTRIITLSFTSLSRQKAKFLADDYARLYLSQQLETRFQATQEANKWLTGRLNEMRGQVIAAETAVQQYKIENGLVNVGSDNTFAQQEITTLDQQLATVKVDQAESDAKLAVARRQLQSGSTGEDVGAALDSAVIKDLRSQRAQVSQHLADLETRYGPLHPEIIKSKHQLEDIDTQIKAEIKRIIANLEAQAQIQHQRTASLSGSVYKARGTLSGNNRALVKLNELQRNAEAITTLYQSYLDRVKQTSAQEGLDHTDARIVSAAALPTQPSEPNRPVALAISFLGALSISLGLALVRRAMDAGLTTSIDVESNLNLPYLAGISTLGTTQDKLPPNIDPVSAIIDMPLSAYSEGFRSLRASLLYSRVGESIKLIAITSSLPGEGKTTTSVCLAQTAAMAGQNVLVVDCDLRRRTINAVVGIEPHYGLLEVLSGSCSLEQALVRDQRSGVIYLPLTKNPFTPKDVFGSQAFKSLIQTLRLRFDLIILDTAPVLPVAETRILARQADVVALLVRWRKTQKQAVKTAISLLLSSEAKIGGVALTQINSRDQAKYGYGDTGYYYSQYSKYYTNDINTD